MKLVAKCLEYTRIGVEALHKARKYRDCDEYHYAYSYYTEALQCLSEVNAMLSSLELADNIGMIEYIIIPIKQSWLFAILGESAKMEHYKSCYDVLAEETNMMKISTK